MKENQAMSETLTPYLLRVEGDDEVWSVRGEDQWRKGWLGQIDARESAKNILHYWPGAKIETRLVEVILTGPNSRNVRYNLELFVPKNSRYTGPAFEYTGPLPNFDKEEGQ